MAYLGFVEARDKSGRLIKIRDGTTSKVCKVCGEEKDFTDFRIHSKVYLGGVCKKCLSDKKNAEYRVTRDAVQAYKRERGCVFCGYDEPCALDFHHKDPEEKDFTIGKMMSNQKLSRLMTEIDKCVVVCANCHRELHAGLREITDDMLERGDASGNI